MSENVKDPYEARVNMMIKQRMALRHKDDKNHVRRKRYPLGIIEYYDYDEEMNEGSRESQIIGDNEEKNTNQNDSPIDSSFRLDANLRETQNETLMKKKNEEAEEQEKQKKRKEKLKNKEPKQQFLVDLEQQARAKNENPSESLRSKVTFQGVEKGEDKSSQMDREKSFLNEAVQPSGQIRDEKSFVPACQTKWSNNRRKEQDENDRVMEEPNQEFVNIDKVVPKESLEYILRAPETLQREIVDVVFGDVQPIQLPEHDKKLDNVDQTRLENRVGSKKLDEKEYDDIDNVYDELKKLYDWEDNENKNGPRLKGDQRMHLDASEDDFEIKTNTNDNNNNNNSNNTSESNYLALKKTDDLFKGGLEQSDIFEERSSNKSQNQHHHQNSSNNYAGNIEWKVIPVVETINDSRSKSSGVVRSGLSKRKTAPENDSGSPYENGKYHDSMNELEENVRNVIDGDKRSVLESKDMHESFVEPMDRIDDFDDDIKVRLGRGLKTIDDNYLKNATINNYTNRIILSNEYLTTTIKTTNISTKYEITNHFYSSSSSSSVLENINDNSNTMRKKETKNEDTRRKKLAMLLTADNIEDESQMDLALHGELAGKIVENIFEQVQRNEALKVALGPGLYRKNKHEDEIETNQIYHRGLDENDIKHTEKTMKKIMELLDRLVLDEVQSKTCAKLPPDMQEFLEWMLQVKGEKQLYEQTPLLPLVNDQETTEHPVDDDKIIFPKTSDEEIDKDLNEFQKKVRILQNLINEYNALSAKEKIKVQTVHDYLVRQLNVLLHYIEMKEKSKKNDTIDVPQTEEVRRNTGFILHYQNASPKFKFDDNVTVIKDPNVSEFWKLNDTRFSLDIERNKRRPVRSYYDHYLRNKKKRKKRKKGKRKRRRRRNELNYGRRDTPEYRKLARRAAMIRKKRDDYLEDEWNQFDFKYEQPKIYKSMSIMNDPIEKIRNERSTDLQQKEREILKTDNVTITNFDNNNFDDLPVKGRNLAEDEMILLNKREAWKKENERQLEEVAFGKDMRNKIREEEQFKRLIGIKGKRMANEKNKLREKRENIKEKQNFIRSNSNVTLSINVTTVSYNEPTIVNLSSNFLDTKIISLEKRNDTNENEE
ncbi:protein PFC0760c-like, partial [Polistes fuscatus]|uniref:protein PFC0760c-like n=1 Tax=Polistes fuscatus TaxID=30207 RepID=UPI001CA8BB3C